MRTGTKLEDLFEEQLENLLDAAKQIVEALPKMVVQAASEELATAFEQHLGKTNEQVTRLEIIFGREGVQPGARKSEGMQALLSEAEQSCGVGGKPLAGDLALMTSARRMAHYAIASYSAACVLAETLGQFDNTLAKIGDALLSGGASAPGTESLPPM